MSGTLGRGHIAVGFLIMVVVSIGSAVAVLTVEGIGSRVSDIMTRMTGMPTVYGARDATQRRLDATLEDRQRMGSELEQCTTELRGCERDRASLPALLAKHSEQQQRLAKATRATRLLHSSIYLGLTRHLQSAGLKALPTVGTGVVMAMTVAEMSLLCYQFDQVAALRRSLAPDGEDHDRPLFCRPGTDALAKAVYERVFHRDRDINWREECVTLQTQGVPILDCDQFPTQGPVDPDAWTGQATSLGSLQPVDPDAWIRKNVEGDALRPVDPN